jgi:N-acetylglucosaminyl-diphospho-decaprenol L-rhamnosyltransferase
VERGLRVVSTNRRLGIGGDPNMENVNIPDAINVVIVNFRTPDLTIRCIRSILTNLLVDLKNIIVVDNASGDDSVRSIREKIPNIKIIQSEINCGYGGAVNIGAAESDSEFILVLNPDTYFEDRSIFRAIDLMKIASDIGIIGLDLVHPCHERQYSGRRFYTMFDIILRRLPLGKFPPFKSYVDQHLMRELWETGRPFEAEWVLGAGFIIRRELFIRIRGIDEAYFLYMEDVDLCARVWKAGYRVVCIPGVTLVHDHKRASASNPFGRAARRHMKSLMLFRERFRLPVVRRPGINGLWR